DLRTVLHTAADAVKFQVVTFQMSCDIRDFCFHESERGVVAQVYLRPQPNVVEFFPTVAARKKPSNLAAEHITQGKAVRSKVKSNLRLALLDLVEPQLIINNTPFEVDIRAVD